LKTKGYRFSTKKGVIVRKILHLITILAPTYYIFGSKENLIRILFPLTGVFILAEVARLYIKPLRRIFLRIFAPMLWKDEEKGLTAATRWLIAASIVCGYFPRNIAILTLFFVAISDTAAYAIGSRFGRKEIVRGKTFLGTLTFLVTANVIALFSPLPKIISIPGAVTATLVELIPRYDDNLSIPLITGIVLWIMTYLLKTP
jgi:dolichol kinase